MDNRKEAQGRLHPAPMQRILFLTHRPLTDDSSGGVQRSSHIRRAAQDVGDVDTLVIHSDVTRNYSSDWDVQRTMTLGFRCGWLRPAALLDRLWVRRRVLKVLMDGRYDIVIARYLSIAITIPCRYRNRLILDADDILKTQVRSGAPIRRAIAIVRTALRERLMRNLLGQVAHVWFVNSRDLSTLGPLASSVSLLPNAGITYELPIVERQAGSMMIVGDYSHPPNREAVDFFLDEVMPALRQSWPGVVLRIVGSVPDDCARKWASWPDVHVMGFVQDLGAEYARTALALAPIQSGGGTQIKVIEALANACPAVVSRFAYAGFCDTVDVDRHLYVADSVQEWVESCLRVFEDPVSSEAMARAAAKLIRQTHGVAAMQEHVRHTLLRMLPERS